LRLRIKINKDVERKHRQINRPKRSEVNSFKNHVSIKKFVFSLKLMPKLILAIQIRILRIDLNLWQNLLP